MHACHNRVGAHDVIGASEPLALLFAFCLQIIHDHGHPGLTNDFLVATSHPLALRYNDREWYSRDRRWHYTDGAFGGD